MLRTLDPTCLGIFSTCLSCGGILSIKDTAEIILRRSGTSMGRVGALVSGAAALLTTCARGLVNIRGKARSDAGLGCCDGVQAVRRGSGARVGLIREDASDSSQWSLDSA